MQIKELLEIVKLTLAVCLSSTLLSAFIGIPLGILLGLKNNRIIRMIRTIVTTFVGIPPVLAGLVVYMLVRNGGALGKMQILFTPAAMVLAQILIVTPIIAAIVFPAVSQKSAEMTETLHGVNIGGLRRFFLLTGEYKSVLCVAVLSGFGRAISEVGAVSMVGGNILHKTRVMTTAIMLETSKGNFEQAIALGFGLLGFALIINFLTFKLREE